VNPTLPTTDTRPVLEVVVLYEDTVTRDRALQVCDHLAVELEDEVKLQFTWWRLDFLLDARIAWEATEAAVRAGMIVFSLHLGNSFPPPLQHWIASWADDRDAGEGAVVGLIGLGTEPSNWTSPRHQLLAKLAGRAGMDYLPQGHFNPDEISAAAMSSVGERAHSLTPVLKDILTQPHPSSHWGLNE
jgi:hypothetical protein